MNVIQYTGLGHGHFLQGKPCQDYAAAAVMNENEILTLADGCGSYDFSRDAAIKNVETVISFFGRKKMGELERLYKDAAKTKEALLRKLWEGLEETARTRQLSRISGLAATMLFAVRNRRCNKVLLGHIGDGHILCFSGEGNLTFHSVPENGDTKEETYYPNNEDAPAHLRLTLVDAADAEDIVMFSDGPERYFEALGNGDVAEGAARLLQLVRSGELRNDIDLQEHLWGTYSDEITKIEDDWTLLIGHEAMHKTHRVPQRPPASPKQPDLMSLWFALQLIGRKPEAEPYNEELLRNAMKCFLQDCKKPQREQQMKTMERFLQKYGDDRLQETAERYINEAAAEERKETE